MHVGLRTQVLILHYTEAMESTSLNGSALRLQATNQSADGIDLAGGSVLGGDDSTLYYNLSQTTLAKIKAHTSIAVSQSSTYLSAGHGHATDMSGNEAGGVASSDALQMGPVLQKFTLDMDTGVLLLMFSEDMNITTFTLSGLTLVAETKKSTSTYTPVDANKTTTSMSTLATNNEQTIKVELAPSDITAIKLVDGLATTSALGKLAIEGHAMKDTAVPSNYVLKIPVSNAIESSMFVADTTGHSLGTCSNAHASNASTIISHTHPFSSVLADVGT